jgi:hypothetical protein
MAGRDREGRRKKLRSGVLLILRHPEVAFRNCDDCQRWIYDHKTGRRATSRGQPIPRPAKSRLPCDVQDGCAKGSPNGQRELTKANWQAYLHYLESRATGTFPDDALVRRHAAIIRSVEDAVGRLDK